MQGRYGAWVVLAVGLTVARPARAEASDLPPEIGFN
jgi:hypothetical protein